MTIKKDDHYQNILDIIIDARLLCHRVSQNPRDAGNMVDSFKRCQEDLYTVLRFVVDIYNNGK